MAARQLADSRLATDATLNIHHFSTMQQRYPQQLTLLFIAAGWVFPAPK